MRTNRVGQKLRDDAPVLPSDNYEGEFFVGPDQTAHECEVSYQGNPKVYNMGYLQGSPHLILESYYGEGVVVRYLITGVTYSWDWKDRNNAWVWANNRKEHIKMLR